MISKSSKSEASLSKIEAKLKTGSEHFLNQHSNPNIDVRKFWQWSSSNLLTNTTRGILAEFLVASSLGLLNKPRDEWENYDIAMNSGVKIEVKSVARYQVWKQKQQSTIKFDIKKRLPWDEDTGEFVGKPVRFSKIYVFCVLNSTEPMDLDDWDFYVLLTEHINEKCGEQKTITLTSLQNRFPELKKCRFDDLHTEIKSAENNVIQKR